MQGIHAVQSKPVSLLSAVWDPFDPYQRDLVLDWLASLDVAHQVDNFYGDLLLGGTTLRVYPDDVLVLDPSGRIGVFRPEVYEQQFDYVAPVVDPGQPPLFDVVFFVVP